MWIDDTQITTVVLASNLQHQGHSRYLLSGSPSVPLAHSSRLGPQPSPHLSESSSTHALTDLPGLFSILLPSHWASSFKCTSLLSHLCTASRVRTCFFQRSHIYPILSLDCMGDLPESITAASRSLGSPVWFRGQHQPSSLHGSALPSPPGSLAPTGSALPTPHRFQAYFSAVTYSSHSNLWACYSSRKKSDFWLFLLYISTRVQLTVVRIPGSQPLKAPPGYYEVKMYLV